MRTRRHAGAGRSRLLAGLTLGVLALTIGGYAAYRALTDETAAPASAGTALAAFRAQDADARTLPPALRDRAPLPGVYAYATHGSEVSHVLGTRRHAYPRETTMTVTATPRGCLRTRWDALATRSDATLTCPRADGSWRLVTHSQRHRFAGHADARTYVCAHNSTFLPARLTTGARWRSRCATDGTTTAASGVVRGPRLLVLRGRRLRTVLLRTRTRLSGETAGSVRTLRWVDPRTRSILLQTTIEQSRTDTAIGDVRYEERVSIALSSPRPRR